MVLLLGVGVWIGVEQLREKSPAEQNKQALLEGIRQGRTLYQKEVRYYNQDHPQNTIAEHWIVADKQGQRVAVAWMLRDLEGNLLSYMKLHEDGTLTRTSSLAHEFLGYTRWPRFIPLPGTEISGIEDIERYFSVHWDYLLSLQDSELESKGRGTLNGRTSLIFEREYGDGPTRKIEVVENAPLLRSESYYEDGVLMQQITVVEHRLLPPGSALPNPPAHGVTVNYYGWEEPIPSARQ